LKINTDNFIVYSSIFGKRSLSTVVRTENIRCKIIPSKNNNPKVMRKGELKNLEIPYAARIVSKTSAIATLRNLYL
jgi:hypothetical protein